MVSNCPVVLARVMRVAKKSYALRLKCKCLKELEVVEVEVEEVTRDVSRHNSEGISTMITESSSRIREGNNHKVKIRGRLGNCQA